VKLALAQLNPIVGDLPGNRERIAATIARAEEQGVDLAVFPELSVAGYPPRDLVRKQQFVRDSVAAVEWLAERCRRTAALVGFVRPTPGGQGRPLQNAAALLAGGKVQSVHVKTLLPTYDVFDETRYFEPGDAPACFEVAGTRVGLTICEDLWDAEALGRRLYGEDPVARLTGQRAELIVNMAASPFQLGKPAQREDLLRRRAKRSGAGIVYVNQVGGNDELIFDGGSCVVGADGALLARAASFAEDLLIVGLEAGEQRREEPGEEIAQLAAALRLGLRDYVRKCGFSSVVLGLSGGVDSAVVAALAADAIGPGNVHALAMPGRYSAPHSLEDAERLAENVGLRLRTLSIETLHAAYEAALSEALAGGDAGTTYENVQARIRGAIVMAVSNAFAHLPLATGNKSELSTGYCTLYGDMCGGLAPIGDVLKTTVYELGRHLNVEAGFDRIPERTLTRAPSAELKPDQVDQDKLPPYDVLDPILARYIEGDATAEAIIEQGFDADTVRKVVRMVDVAEYKRKQAAPVLKVTSRAFGSGRRMPIAQAYRPREGG